MASWTGGITRATGDIITAAMWNAHMGAAGDLDYLHEGGQLVIEQLTHVAGSTWRMSSNYRAGKILNLVWRNVAIKLPAAAGYYTESDPDEITFTTAMKDDLNGGNDTAAGDSVTAVYLKDE